MILSFIPVIIIEKNEKYYTCIEKSTGKSCENSCALTSFLTKQNYASN